MQSVKLNLTPTGVMPHIYCSRYDTGRQFALFIYDVDKPYVIPEDASIKLHGIKEDGKVFTYGSDDTDSNITIDRQSSTVTVTTTEQMTAVAGEVVCELAITQGTDTTIGTLNFFIDVEDGALPVDEKTSKSDLETYQQMIDSAKVVSAHASESVATAKQYSDEAQKSLEGSKEYYDKLQSLTNIGFVEGATATADGVGGMVTAPKKGEQDDYFGGDGAWHTIQSALSKVYELKTMTLLAASWSNAQYSFEATYPSASYDIEQVQPYGTADQVKAYAKAQCVGTPSSNTLIAQGTVPTVDIPVMFYLRKK